MENLKIPESKVVYTNDDFAKEISKLASNGYPFFVKGRKAYTFGKAVIELKMQ